MVTNGSRQSLFELVLALGITLCTSAQNFASLPVNSDAP